MSKAPACRRRAGCCCYCLNNYYDFITAGINHRATIASNCLITQLIYDCARLLYTTIRSMVVERRLHAAWLIWQLRSICGDKRRERRRCSLLCLVQSWIQKIKMVLSGAADAALPLGTDATNIMHGLSFAPLERWWNQNICSAENGAWSRLGCSKFSRNWIYVWTICDQFGSQESMWTFFSVVLKGEPK
jgi:hypothetical protein